MPRQQQHGEDYPEQQQQYQEQQQHPLQERPQEQQQQPAPPRNPLKVFVCGDDSSGRSSLVALLTTGQFPEQSFRTLGIEVHQGTLDGRNGEGIPVAYWEGRGSAAHFSPGSLLGYSIGSDAVVVVYNPQLRDGAAARVKAYREATTGEPGRDVPTVVVAGRADLLSEAALAKIRNDDDWFPVSARTGMNVSRLRDWLAAHLQGRRDI
ncbi:P-loop containing nucleoside triphosphate hydrolase protein [Zopfochytrium polystomum]|nr:P-loop containing nucleoside triphosphate hydrolase protein [Zopfochytrium polystomum]